MRRFILLRWDDDRLQRVISYSYILTMVGIDVSGKDRFKHPRRGA